MSIETNNGKDDTDEESKGDFSNIPTNLTLGNDPYIVEGLVIHPLHGQEIHGKINVDPGTLGLVIDGLDAYLDERCIATHDIPSTYSNWDDEFVANPTDSRGTYFEGPVGVANNEDNEACRFSFRSSCVRATVRILNGPGRFDAADYRFHETVPFGVVESEIASLAIAPLYQSLQSVDEPVFTYRSTDAGPKDFRLVE